MKTFDIAFIGAGASALMCASGIKNQSIALIESSQTLAPKIRISGGGKCNFTNHDISETHYRGDAKAIKKCFASFNQKDLLAFFQKEDLSYERRDHGKYFCKNSAKDIIKIFSQLTKHCDMLLNHTVKEVTYEDDFIIETNQGTIHAKRLVVASGGLSYASVGASDIGFKIAQSFGHTIIKPQPALVGLTVQKDQFWMKSLSGISLLVSLQVGEKIFKDQLLFTHKGISGPAVLSGSLYWEKGTIMIDFLPEVRIAKLIAKKSDKQISSLLPLPKRFIKEYLKSVDLDDVPIKRLTPQEIEKLTKLHHYELPPAGNFGYTKAEVTRGGVDTSEMNMDTFESLKKKDLYFIGEVLNVTGELGGYNFQWAFSSAKVLAEYLTKR
ncbi:NAD(P)/FAD-dependent oxidoreductase [Sulfurospirillum sp. 1612]|uniref:NAD(P)/FAD-dependent oxidoreductase n=1 Tax=Sulfurospirillum sp. 1612 TaxID=3094835 RepID=UPI002F91D479